MLVENKEGNIEEVSQKDIKIQKRKERILDDQHTMPNI